jgi:predicted lipid-binding transport protein (Tim44 family)
MRNWLLAAGIVILGGVLAIPDAEARRFGGGRNIGAQRNVTAPPARTPAKPAQQQAAQGQQQGAQPAATGSRWAPILGGLALGGILGYMLGGGGLMGALLGIALLAGIVMLAAVAFRAFAARRQEQPVQYAGMSGGIRETASVPVTTQLPAGRPGRVPAGFDAAGFLRAAKMNFLRLQAANDAGRLEEIREFTTDELYEELKRELGSNQQTDIVALEADLLEVAQEGDRHWASVRFSGTVTEAPGAAPEAFTEVWNLVKPADGSSGWLLAGIQQMH